MSFVVSYTKAQYEAKLTELKGYWDQLSGHLTEMENLKEGMYQFWDDNNARSTGMALAQEIRQVKNAMDRTKDMITFYESSINKLDGANLNVSDSVGEALSILGELGIE